MARTNIDVVITVRDGLSKPLDNVNNKLKNTGKAARDAEADFIKFNKTLFTTAAFVGTFIKGFNAFKNSLVVGAELDRVTTQFERVLGPRGAFVTQLQKASNVVVDEMTAMQSGLQLGNLGVVKSSEDAAGVVSKLAVAARLAGKDTTEGVQDLTKAIIEGNVARLEEYGLLKRSDPQYMALMATLNKAGGVYGTLYAKQASIAAVMSIIDKKTRDSMFSFMSLGELVQATGKRFQDLRQHIGILLGNAVRPLLEKLLPFITNLKEVIYNIYKFDKQTMFLIKTVLAFTTAITGLVATLGTLKLVVKLLGFAGLGFPGLITSVITLTGAFVGLTHSADGALEKLKLLGAIFKGIYELVTNLDPETGMSKISKSTRDLLEKHGLLGFIKTISRIVSAIKTVAQDVFKIIKNIATKVDEVFGGMFVKFKDMIANFTKSWTTWWTSDALTPIQKFVRAATVLLGGFLAVVGLKGLGGIGGKLLSKVPVIGRFFGGSGPKGTPTDPIYVAQAGLGGAMGGLGGLGAAGMTLGQKAAAVLASGAVGYAIGSQINSMLPTEKNQYGQESNAVERAMAWVSSRVGPLQATMMGLPSITKDQYDEMYGPGGGQNAAGGSGGKQTQVSVPTVPADDISIVQALGEQMKNMEQKDRDKMQSAVESALATRGADGRLIDPDEFKNFENIMVNALDSSENLTTLANRAKENMSVMRGSKRD